MLSRTLLKPSAAPTARLLPSAVRALHGSNERASEAKIPSRDSINVSSKESTRSGTNDELAHNNTAYDPSTTNPQTEKRQSGVEVGSTPSSSLFSFSSLDYRQAPTSSAPTSSESSGSNAGFCENMQVRRDGLFAAAATTTAAPSAEEISMFLSGFWL